MTLHRWPGLWLRLYAVVAVANLVAAVTDLRVLFGLTLVALMPLLTAFLLAARRGVDRGRESRLLRWTLAALVFSWLGDVAGTQLPAKVLAFLLAQTCYIVAFWPYRRRSSWSRPLQMGAYLVAIALVLGLVAQHAGPLALPVILYAASLAAMAALATGVHRLAGLGGALFVVSDSILALDTFVPWFSMPSAPFWYMLAYLTGQALLVWGALQSVTAEQDQSG